MLVCLCNGISDRDIRSALEGGIKSFAEVRSELGVATNCGQCACHAKEVISDTLSTPAQEDFDKFSYSAV